MLHPRGTSCVDVVLGRASIRPSVGGEMQHRVDAVERLAQADSRPQVGDDVRVAGTAAQDARLDARRAQSFDGGAAEGSGGAGIIEHFNGPTAVAISYDDPAGLAKIVSGFAKENEDFEIKAGVLDGNVIGTDEIATLATLPSLDALRGQIIGLLLAPASKLARLLMEPGAQLARLADARGGQEDASG